MTDRRDRRRKLGQALRSLREAHGLTIYDIAERMGKKRSSGSQVGRWERGEVAIAGDQLWAFLEALDFNFFDLAHELHPAPVTDSRLEEIARQLEQLGR